MVIAHARRQIETSPRALAILRRQAARLRVDGPQRVRTHAHLKQAIHRLCDIEAIEPIQYLIGRRTAKMNLVACVCEDAGNQRQCFTIIAGRRIRQRKNFAVRQRRRDCGLCGIDSRWRSVDVHRLRDLLLVIDRDFQTWRVAHAHIVSSRGVKTFLLNLELIGGDVSEAELVPSGRVGFGAGNRPCDTLRENE